MPVSKLRKGHRKKVAIRKKKLLQLKKELVNKRVKERDDFMKSLEEEYNLKKSSEEEE